MRHSAGSPGSIASLCLLDRLLPRNARQILEVAWAHRSQLIPRCDDAHLRDHPARLIHENSHGHACAPPKPMSATERRTTEQRATVPTARDYAPHLESAWAPAHGRVSSSPTERRRNRPRFFYWGRHGGSCRADGVPRPPVIPAQYDSLEAQLSSSAASAKCDSGDFDASYELLYTVFTLQSAVWHRKVFRAELR